MSKLKLTDRGWREFFIAGNNGIFDITATQSGIDKNKLNTASGNVPYITRSDINNGINLFISDVQSEKYKRDEGNVITIGLDTQTVFYQKNAFYTGQNIQVLRCVYLNYWVAMFIIPLLRIQMQKFSWGSTGATLSRLKRTKIMLPVTQKEFPDWQFMEDFIKQKKQAQTEKLVDYYSQRAMELMIETGEIVDTEWKTFFFSDIFTKIQRGKRLTKASQQQGEMPYISSTAKQNGVDNFIDNDKNVRCFENCLTLANSGSVGATFFHHYQFVASDHVTALELETSNKYVYLFLASLIKRLEEKYSFNREINDRRIQREKFVLPVNKNGDPDWQFMENFIKQIEKNKTRAVLKYHNPLKYNKIMRGGVLAR